MVTFIIEEKTLKQLKKFIGGWDTPNEHLYLYTDVENQLYLVLFDNEHIYISYLKLGVTDEFKDESHDTYEINASWIKGENEPKHLKKFISKRKELELRNVGTCIEWFGDDYDFVSDKTPCDLNLDLAYFLIRSNKEFHLQKQDFKVLELYKNDYTCLYFKKGIIEFKIYDDEYKVFAKHIICDTYNNDVEEHYHLSNKHLNQLLRKFNSKDEILLKLDEDEPLVIQHDDYIGILAPRILFEEGYGSIDGLYDELGGD